jgi:ribosomal protein L22
MSPRLPSRRSKDAKAKRAGEGQQAAAGTPGREPEATPAAKTGSSAKGRQAAQAEQSAPEKAAPATQAQAKEKPAAAEKRRTSAPKPASEEESDASPKAGAKDADKPKRPRRRGSTQPPSPSAPKAKAQPRRRANAQATRVVVSARARYVRTSPRKARMVCGHLRGRSVQEARAVLSFTPRAVAGEWSKLLESAVANAEHNHELHEDDLVVREAFADVGPTIKRYRPRALGRATSIHKRTSHLTITLSAGD